MSEIALHPSLVRIDEADEYLHPIADDAHYTSIETSFFGFNVASAGIDGQYYVWMHPKLRVMAVMIFIFRGIKSRQLTAEYFNEHAYLPMLDRLDHYRIDVGSCAVEVRVVDPLKEIELTLVDERRGMRLDLTTRAAFPPVGRSGGGHFTQVMKNSGMLELNGEHHAIDGYFVRDRSWNQMRGEEPQLGPPYNWMTGVFGDDLAFHAAILDTTILDAPQYGPDWFRVLDPDNAAKTMRFDHQATGYDRNLRAGYWFQDGPAPKVLRAARHRTIMGADGYTPVAAEMVLTDETGEEHAISGRVLSFLPKMYGQNIVTNNAFMEWTYRGRVGHGEMMIVFDNLHLQGLDERIGHASRVFGG